MTSITNMSEGQLYGAVLGGAIGTLVPGANLAMGVQVGMFIGGVIDPLDPTILKQEGPRLKEISVQTAEWGTPIPRINGAYRVGGNVIWSAPIKETETTEENEGGKGGSSPTIDSTTYTYSGSWAVAFCEGEVDGITKIWLDSVLVYDGENFSGGLNSNNFEIYNGSITQPVDWYIESYEADTPAYRNIVYIVFRDIQLESYGNRIPTVTAEVVENGTANSSFTQVTTTGYEEGIINTYFDNIISYPTAVYDAYGNYYMFSMENTTGNPEFNDTRAHTLYKFDYNGNLITSRASSWGLDFEESTSSIIKFVGNDYIVTGIMQTDFNDVDKDDPRIVTVNVQNDYLKTIYSRSFYVAKPSYTYLQPIEYGAYADYSIWLTMKDTNPTKPYYNQPFSYILDTSLLPIVSGDEYYGSGTDTGEVINWGDVSDIYPDYGFSGHEDSFYFYSNPNNATVGKEYIIRKFHKSGSLTGDINLSSLTYKDEVFKDTTLFVYHENVIHMITGVFDTNKRVWYTYNQTNGEVEEKIITSTNANSGTMPGGTIYGTGFIRFDTNKGMKRYREWLEIAQTPISETAEKILLRCGVDSNDFDISAGTDTYHGYLLPGPATGRGALTPLLSAHKYMLIENGWELELVARNTTSLFTLDKDNIVELTEIKRIQNSELSRQINVLYSNKNTNYGTGMQGIRRNDPDTVNVKNVQYPLVLSDTQAKQLAEFLMYSEWNERMSFKFTITNDYLSLIPSNVITLDWKNSLFKVRIDKISFITDSSIECEAFLEDEIVYNTVSVGSDTGNTYIQTEVDRIGPTNMVILDIPMLDNAFNAEGVYIAADGFYQGWDGCNIEKSTDSGLSFSRTTTISGGTIIGSTASILQSGPTTTWDLDNSVTVIVNKGTLYSTTEEEMVSNSVNYALVGNEILQFRDVVDNANNTYTLSGLLRGRRGTEWAIDTHDYGEDFVLFDNDMSFDRTATLGELSIYRGYTHNDYTGNYVEETILPEIICLKPLAPSVVHATRDGSDNITITWMRRSREVTGYFKSLGLYEESESYEVVITNGRTISVSAEIATYTAAQQTTDGITPGDTVQFTIYQLSATVGRGYGTGGSV
jgi:hypothetical protein